MEKSAIPNAQFLRSIPTMEHLWGDLDTLLREHHAISFLCYDIHSLRKINRAYGRKAGDALLAAVAEWTLGFPGGRLYRIEGDQFCMVFTDLNLNGAHRYAASLESRFGKVWHLNVLGRKLDIFAQASIAVLGDLDGDFREDLPDLLEQALEISKREQKITVFDAEADKVTRAHVRLQMELKSCLLSDMTGFYLNFQPLADPVSGTWCGLEALCRWHGPSIGAVPPSIFIEEVEEMGLIHTLGAWVLDKALETCKALRLDEIEHFFVTINVSAIQMNRRSYMRTVMDALEKHHYPANKLMLEITESTQFSFNDMTMTAIDMLRQKGVLFALDDFGTGYSGFSNLKNLPVDMLKTDSTFIKNIENDTYLQYFYYIMSETAHANGMQLIAEGIETQEQLESVVKNGADIVQGYLSGWPMDEEAIARSRDNFFHALPAFSGRTNEMSDFKHWINSQHAYKITPSLFGLQNKCINIVLDEDNIEAAFEKILEAVGMHFKVHRVYVFLRDEAAVFSEKYEWCAEGVETQTHLFQKIDTASDGFYHLLQNNEVVIASSEGQLPHNLTERLAAGARLGAVQSIVAMPMKQRGEILGFIGFDYATARDWVLEELIILHNLCLLCLIVLEKQKPDRAC